MYGGVQYDTPCKETRDRAACRPHRCSCLDLTLAVIHRDTFSAAAWQARRVVAAPKVSRCDGGRCQDHVFLRCGLFSLKCGYQAGVQQVLLDLRVEVGSDEEARVTHEGAPVRLLGEPAAEHGGVRGEVVDAIDVCQSQALLTRVVVVHALRIGIDVGCSLLACMSYICPLTCNSSYRREGLRPCIC